MNILAGADPGVMSNRAKEMLAQGRSWKISLGMEEQGSILLKRF